jgi:hypothetical protein
LVKERRTAFHLPPELQGISPTMPSIFAALAKDEQRNTLIVDDVLDALQHKRNPLVLTERRDHLEFLAECFKGAARNITVLRGGMNATQRRAAESSRRAPEEEERLILATGKYLGEGFDDSRLDTLFIAMPIAWKGALAQYVGRLHREHPGKRDVIVYDYVDAEVPVLSRMAAKRQAGYRALGYRFDVSGSSQMPSARRFATAQDDSDAKLSPSTVTDRYWIYAERKDVGAYQAHGPRGGTWRIPYKTDANTIAGRYSKDGIRVSKLYE